MKFDPILMAVVGVLLLLALLRPVAVLATAVVITLALAVRHHQAPYRAIDVGAVASVPTVAPRPHQLFELAESLQLLPAREVRALTGIKSKALRKSVLVEQLVTMPI
jgi:hypothetical protein